MTAKASGKTLKSRTKAMTVDCPRCGASKGWRCWRSRTTPKRGSARVSCHNERHEAAQ